MTARQLYCSLSRQQSRPLIIGSPTVSNTLSYCWGFSGFSSSVSSFFTLPFLISRCLLAPLPPPPSSSNSFWKWSLLLNAFLLDRDVIEDVYLTALSTERPWECKSACVFNVSGHLTRGGHFHRVFAVRVRSYANSVWRGGLGVLLWQKGSQKKQ